MIRITAFLFAAASLQAYCVTSYPQSLKTSALMLGTARDWGVWSLYVTETTGPVSRRDIVIRLPFSPLMQWQADDVLNRRASTSGWGTFAAYLGPVKDLAPAGLAYAGARNKSDIVKGALLGAAGIWALGVARIGARAPNPSETKAHLLPDAGSPGDGEYVIITGIVKGAAKVGPVCQ